MRVLYYSLPITLSIFLYTLHLNREISLLGVLRGFKALFGRKEILNQDMIVAVVIAI